MHVMQTESMLTPSSRATATLDARLTAAIATRAPRPYQCRLSAELLTSTLIASSAAWTGH